MMAQIPAECLLQSGVEIRRFKIEHTLGFGDHLRDGRHVEVDAEVELGAHGMATCLQKARAGNAYKLRFLARDLSEDLYQLRLCHWPGIGDVEGVTDGRWLLCCSQGCCDQILHINEL